MKYVYNKSLGAICPLEPPKPAKAASKKFQKPSKKPLRTRRGERNLKRGGFINHVSEFGGCHPSEALALTKKFAAAGHSNITFNEKTGDCHVRNATHRQWRKALKLRNLNDQMSYL